MSRLRCQVARPRSTPSPPAPDGRGHPISSPVQALRAGTTRGPLFLCPDFPCPERTICEERFSCVHVGKEQTPQNVENWPVTAEGGARPLRSARQKSTSKKSTSTSC